MHTIVNTRQGKVRGLVRDGVSAFLGIPYAAPPFGPHRFRAPAPAEPWEGVRDALEFGPTVPQTPYGPALGRLIPTIDIPGDGCLNLNVWAPADGAGGAGDAGRPVMVWIHGGSLRNGSTALPLYDGSAFARDGVVLVSVNHRLGVEGFGVFPDAPDNRGLLDQIAALAWVRDNIAAFGGDPGNVTLFGESAGAIGIAALMSGTRARGLFHRAILQSGPPGAVPREKGAEVVRRIARRLGAPATAAAFAAVDRRRLLEAQNAVVAASSPLGGGPGFQIVVDEDVVSAAPPPCDVDLLLGSNLEEYRLWFVPDGTIDRIGGLTLRLASLKFKIPGRVARLYRAGRPGARPGEVLGAMATDLLLRGPVNRWADARADGPARTFVYEFAWRSPVLGLGACHALEIGFAFDTLSACEDLAGPGAPQGLADTVHRAWVSFAESGDPGWPTWSERRPVRVFDDPDPGVVHAPRHEELSAWL
ncbi:carboxylesterase/lipase family protein [Nocardiopsis protaetiae]|uniref:carboxylesterase/lipase family protein n=1 Tax=Nocardiopsis protaetiae TaxID=3382270 RepID=UPI00387B53AA